ncbi:MAG: hypothetical protein R3321_03660 [Nitrososphaeraceae archaeon]|nr:hypothetical protein [Nitrososphaeraceae archaeon]
MIKIVNIALIIAFLFFSGYWSLEVFGQQLNNNSNNLIMTEDDQNFSLTSSDIQELKEIAINISMQSKKIIQILEQSGEKAISGVFVGTIAFLVGISLVLFGLRMSQKLSPLLSKYYLVLMLALDIPVTFILVEYLIRTVFEIKFKYVEMVGDPFIIIAILYLIPVIALLSLIYAHGKYSGRK